MAKKTENNLAKVLCGGGSNVPLIREAAERAEELVPALTALLKEPQHARIDAVKGALDYLPLQDWSPLIATALDAFSRDPHNSVARSILGNGLYQAPAAFHPHLARIFFDMEPFLEEFGPGAWRGSGRQSLDFLREALASDAPVLRSRATEVLQQTHDPEVIAYALAEEQKLGSQFYWRYARNQYAYHEYFDVVEGEVHILYSPRAFHLYFPQGHVREKNQSPPLHPTWVNPHPEPQSVAFGGVSDEECPGCGRQLQHLLTLEPLPARLGVSGLPRLVLAACTNGNCLGLGLGAELFYHHDERGRPHGIFGDSVTREWELPYLASTTARLGLTAEQWTWQDSNSRWANLHRLGGLPSWVQEPGHPGCLECGHSMSFLLQLDSGLLAEEGGYVHWCDGLFYAFWCVESN
jgi:hypothetical protein